MPVTHQMWVKEQGYTLGLPFESECTPSMPLQMAASAPQSKLPGHQSDHGMVASSTSGTITGGSARQFSSYPNHAPRTEGRNVIDLEEMAADFVRAEDGKRSGTGCAEDLGREWKSTTII